MAFRFFLIPVVHNEEASSELNQFLRGHRIVKVDRQWVDQGTNSFWSLCVEYLDGTKPSVESSVRPQQHRGKVDYKETMSPEDFAVFAKLREIRKAISQTESIPVYTIFTNEQLAQMVVHRATNRAAIGKIEGIGEARLEKYGRRMLEILATAWTRGVSGEASGQPDTGYSGAKEPALGRLAGSQGQATST